MRSEHPPKCGPCHKIYLSVTVAVEDLNIKRFRYQSTQSVRKSFFVNRVSVGAPDVLFAQFGRTV